MCQTVIMHKKRNLISENHKIGDSSVNCRSFCNTINTSLTNLKHITIIKSKPNITTATDTTTTTTTTKPPHCRHFTNTTTTTTNTKLLPLQSTLESLLCNFISIIFLPFYLSILSKILVSLCIISPVLIESVLTAYFPHINCSTHLFVIITQHT